MTSVEQTEYECPVCATTEHGAVETHRAQSPINSPRGEDRRPLRTTLSYEPTTQLRIFLSYGHDRFQQLAFHIKYALQERGHEVWVDVEKLSAGTDWEDGINSGLMWVKAAQQHGRVLLIMTPHALRNPDGYCINEIARATSNRLSIYPVLVAPSDPPPSIATLPYFDMRDCVPKDPDELLLEAGGRAWHRLMQAHLHGDPVFAEKAQRLYAVLELFDTMTAYGVPAIAGQENLGKFALDAPPASQTNPMSTSGYRPFGMGHAAPPPPLKVDTNSSTESTSSRPQLHTSDSARSFMSEDTSEMSPQHDSVRYMFSFDDSCYVLAQRLYEDLQNQGFSVCAPPMPPTPGDAESRQQNIEAHEDALRWAATDKHGKMILLITPESVGRPHGSCLNDISAAMAAGLGFVPLMVRPCEIPLSICRIQWLDLSDCLNYERAGVSSTASINESRYPARRDQLATAMRGELDHQGQQARLFSLLSPFSFQVQITHLTQGFTGREWLFRQLRDWITTPDACPVFWITGQMGSGKSSIAARMVQTMPEIAAFHLALPEDEQTQRARRCVLSLAYQLTTQLPAYALYLQSGEPLEELVPTSSLFKLLGDLLIKPLNAIARPESPEVVLLLIDGLEQLDGTTSVLPPTRPMLGGARTKNEEGFVALLPSLVSQLPPWVRVVLLSREESSIAMKLQKYQPNIILDRHETENQRDIKAYVTASLCSRETHSAGDHAMMMRNLPSSSVCLLGLKDEQIELIVKRSEGLFLYAANIVQSIADGRFRVKNLESLPIGMGGFIGQFFASRFEPAIYESKIRPIMEVLSAAFEPLTTLILRSVFQWSSYEQQEMLQTIGALFSVSEDDTIRPFHSSVLDWLQDGKTAGAYFADATRGHERLGKWAAKSYLSIVQRKKNDFLTLNFALEKVSSTKKRMYIYIIRHLYNHLMQATDIESMELMGKFARDETFQLARRLLSLRAEGLESFFHGEISREESQVLLRKDPQPGSFLIRYSSGQRAYCASFVIGSDANSGRLQFQHNLIYHLPGGAYSAVPENAVTENTTLFPDLVSFVEEYQRRGLLRTPIPRSRPLNRQISSTQVLV